MRKPECRLYPTCLTRHARRNTGFSCNTCRRYTPANGMSSEELAGLLCLLVAIFDEDARRAHAPGHRLRLLQAFDAMMTEDRPACAPYPAI